MGRFQVVHDWRRYDRRYAVVDTFSYDRDGGFKIMLQTNDSRRAHEYAYELTLGSVRSSLKLPEVSRASHYS